MAWQEHTYRDGDALAEALVERLHVAVRDGIATRGDAVLALAGGRTPLPIYRRMAAMPMGWARVRLVPTDERCVPHDHAACNVRELREAFAGARDVRIDALTVGDGDPVRSEVHARALFETAPYANRDFDAGVLGMGLDGHTASLFPGASQLANALDPAHQTGACRIDPVPLPPEAPFPRITLTLARLLRARELHLVIVGEAKRAVLRAAQADPDPARHPISALLHASHTRVHVHWSPT